MIHTLLATLLSLAAADDVRGPGFAVENPPQNDVATFSGSFALLIGAWRYEHWTRLDTVPSEIAQLKAGLEKQGFVVETSDNGSADAIFSSVRNFIRAHGHDPDARLLIFFAGHGDTRTFADGRSIGMIVGTDAPKRDQDGFMGYVVTMNQFQEWAREIEARHAMFLFDSCFSGSIFGTRGSNETAGPLASTSRRPVRWFFTSGSKDEEVPAQSRFVAVLLEGISGAADRFGATTGGDGYVTGSELCAYLEGDAAVLGTRPQCGKINEPALREGEFVFRSRAPTPTVAVVAKPAIVAPPVDAGVNALEAACNNGTWSACGVLARKHESGDGVRVDYTVAFSFAKKACGKKDPEGCDVLGRLYERGHGVAVDTKKAIAAYDTACTLGSGRGCFDLGNLVPWGGAGDVKAFRAFQRACALRFVDGCAELGGFYEIPRKAVGIAKDVTHALALYAQACDGGSGLGCSYLGEVYEQNVIPNHGSEVRGLFDKGCQLGAGRACSNLVRISGGVTSYESARLHMPLLQKGCDLDDGASCRMLGDAHASLRLPPDADWPTISSLYDKACTLFDWQGCSSYVRLCGNFRASCEDKDRWRRVAADAKAPCDDDDWSACHARADICAFTETCTRAAGKAALSRYCKILQLDPCDEIKTLFPD
jgi:TPR repeat protein